MRDCLFCKIAAGKLEANIVHENETVLAFRDINPQAPTHVLIGPRKHISTINEGSAKTSSWRWSAAGNRR